MPTRPLPLPPLLDAIDAWRLDPDARRADALGAALRVLAGELDLELGRFRIAAPPLPQLDLALGQPAGATDLVLRAPGSDEVIGSVSVAGRPDQLPRLAHALGLGIVAARAAARADRAERQLRAMDQAVRGIGGVLELDPVLQLIVDRVRELAEAQYAALGIVDHHGAIERFHTSGLSDEERDRIGDAPHGRGLLGLIIRENRTYRIPDIAVHPQRYGFPPGHPEMHSFLGMPITAGGVAVGRLYLTNKLGADEFSAEDEALVQMFAVHAGIAIENARLHDQVRRLAIVDERDRISRDLHDSVIQSIYAQTLALDDVPELVTEDPHEAARRVDEAVEALNAVIRDIRNFIFGLRPVLLESGSLAEGLGHLATELRRSGGVEVRVTVSDAAAAEQPPIETVVELLAITREALSNVARHASARHAEVRLTTTGRRLRLEISDDGRGFDARAMVERGHHGLGNMRARAAALGGTFSVTSAPAEGTRIIIAVPRPPVNRSGGENR